MCRVRACFHCGRAARMGACHFRGISEESVTGQTTSCQMVIARPHRPNPLSVPSPSASVCCPGPSPRPFCLLHGGDRLQNWPQEEQGTPLATAHGGSNGEGRDAHRSVPHRLPYTALQTVCLYVHPPSSASPHRTGQDWSSPKSAIMSRAEESWRRAAHRWMRLPEGHLWCAVTALASL
jgi:hypothetical protein